MADDDQKTEEPSGKRLGEAQGKGQEKPEYGERVLHVFEVHGSQYVDALGEAVFHRLQPGLG